MREAEFATLAAGAGLRVVEDKSFNTELKRVFPLVPRERRAGFMASWLAFELQLNEFGIKYHDELASIFRTRNFVLEPAA